MKKMQRIMKKAQEIAHEGVKKFGGKVKDYMSEAMKIAWAWFKSGCKMEIVIDFYYHKKIIMVDEPVNLIGSEKQVEWADKIRSHITKSAIAGASGKWSEAVWEKMANSISALNRIEQASFFIDNRDNYNPDCVYPFLAILL